MASMRMDARGRQCQPGGEQEGVCQGTALPHTTIGGEVGRSRWKIPT